MWQGYIKLQVIIFPVAEEIIQGVVYRAIT